MCNNNWKYIDFNNVNSKTLHLQNYLYEFDKETGKLVERFDLEDRKNADNLKNHLDQFKKDKKTIKERCNVYEFVKDVDLFKYGR